MRFSMGLVAAAFGVLALAGCVGEPTESSGGDSGAPDGYRGYVGPWMMLRDRLADVPCEVDAVDETTSANLLPIAKLGFEGAGSNEIDIRGDLALVGTSTGFRTVDIWNPFGPAQLGEWSEAVSAAEVKFSPDNLTAISGADMGIAFVDIRNPEEPVKVGEWLFPMDDRTPVTNAHMVYSARIAETDWVFIATEDGTGVRILRMGGPPEARTAELVARTLPVPAGGLAPHDMWVTYDEDESMWLLYVAEGFNGWTVYDVSDPAAPELVGGLLHPDTGYTHTIQAAKIGDRRLVATIQEVGANFLEVYDATDLRTPILLAEWTAQPWEGSAAPATPQHNFQIVEGKLYMAHYGLGLFIFDLNALGSQPVAGTLDLQPVAHYGEDIGSPIFGDFWDVVVDRGLIYGGNSGASGLHVIGYGCNLPGEPLLTSTG